VRLIIALGTRLENEWEVAARGLWMGKINVIFLIPKLEYGGGERQIIQLIKGLNKKRFSITLVTFYDGGALRSEAEEIKGVRLLSAKKRGKYDVLAFFFRLWQITRALCPQIIVGYMNLASDLALPLGYSVGAKVVWSLRSSDIDFAEYYRVAQWVFGVGAKLSRFADLIIVNSEAGKQHHLKCGYNQERMVVIPNGIDTDQFRPMVEVGQLLRVRWGLSNHETAIGIVGRLDVIKNHSVFIQAAAILAQQRTDVRFVCVGDGPATYKAILQTLSKSLGLGDRLIWTGALNIMPVVYNALDLLTSTSSSEGFSNVIGEAMACGVPCVVTNVGDSALIVGETGWVVPPKDPKALVQAWLNYLNLPTAEREIRRVSASTRIEKEFNLGMMVTQTEKALRGLLRPEYSA